MLKIILEFDGKINGKLSSANWTSMAKTKIIPKLSEAFFWQWTITFYRVSWEYFIIFIFL